MKTWKIPVCWSMMGSIEVEADTLEEAIEIAEDESEDIPLPDNGEYLTSSWEVDSVGVEFIRHWYNDDQEDEV